MRGDRALVSGDARPSTLHAMYFPSIGSVQMKAMTFVDFGG